MISVDAIDSAINAHGLWKIRLKDAIAQKSSSFLVENVKVDDKCDFGKWLYSFPESDKASNDYQNIKTLHASFHQLAAEILELAVSGKTDEAIKALGLGSQFSMISGKLTMALNRWKETV